MPLDSILDSTSLSTLDSTSAVSVYRLLSQYLKGEQPLKMDTVKLFNNRQSLTLSLDYHSCQLEQINPARFKYLSGEQKVAQLRELTFAFYIFSAQYQLDTVEKRRQTLKERSRQIQRCAYLIGELKRGSEQTPEQVLARAVDDAGKHAKYLGLTVVAPFVAEKMMELVSNKATVAPVKPIRTKEWKGAGKAGVLVNWMNDINGLRLYWVWGGGLLSTVLSMLPDTFANTTQAQQGIASPAPVTGYMSWILYYARFGISLSLLLKHTIAGPWMSEEEKRIPAWDRFKTQWEQRKFALLNDSIWATANLVCFFWLTGGGMLGYYGNVATAMLLIMDVSLTAWRFQEESTKHKETLVRYERDISKLAEKIDAQQDGSPKTILQLQLKQLEAAQKQCKFDWRHKQYALTNDLVYAAALLAAFFIMCCFLFPPAAMVPAAAVIIGVAGAALCFVFTTAYTAIKGGLEVEKLRQTRESTKDEYEELLVQFKAATEEPIKKQLYLDMKQLQAKTVYQKELINFQKMKLINSILFEVLVPALVFTSLVFMPMGVGIAVIAAGLIVAAIANQTLKRFEPKAPSLPDMNEAEYAAFAAAPPSLEKSDKPDVSSNTCLLQFKGLFSGGARKGYVRVPTDEQGIELGPKGNKTAG